MPPSRGRKRPRAETETGTSDTKSTYTEFDPLGDLILEVGPQGDGENAPARYRVCSKSLSRASPVWKAMFYGPFGEGKHDSNDKTSWVVQLPEDDPAALAIVLNIIHGCFDIPEELDLDALLKLAIITDKYDVTHLLKPWAKHWMEGMSKFIEQPGSEPLLWIAWVLGDVTMFSKTAMFIARHSSIDQDGELLNAENHRLQDYLYLSAPDILDWASKFRIGTIERLCGVFNKRIHGLLTKDLIARRSHCKATAMYSILDGEDRDKCVNYVLGQMIYQLSNVDQYPLNEKEISCSTSSFMATLSQVAKTLKPLQASGHCNHAQCCSGSDILDDLKAADRLNCEPLMDHHLDHLLAQAEKSGICNTNT